MTTHFNYTLLLLARQYRRTSQSDLARTAGLNQGHYSRIENGITAEDPAPEVVERIAQALRFPTAFFYQQDGLTGLPLSVHPMNRKKANVAESALRQVHAELNIRLIHLRRYLRSVEIEPELPLPQIEMDEGGGPQEIARKVRRAWSIPDGPIDNLIDYCERAGILVIECDFDAPIDGVTMMVRDLPPTIFLKRSVPADRMRFSLAHELGHVIMHRIPSDSIEDEANAFAGEFLVPEKSFRRSLLGQRLTLEWLARQKAHWRVSMQFLLYRAGALDLVTRHQTEYLWKRISALGWRTREPQETDIQPEKPTVFPKLVRHHAETLGYGIEDLKSLLNIDADDLRRLYGDSLSRHRLYAIK
jgi:Zn-dependent peptidase ImmA (M78 family)/transcriptional regulator with XRE-family HTH domain